MQRPTYHPPSFGQPTGANLPPQPPNPNVAPRTVKNILNDIAVADRTYEQQDETERVLDGENLISELSATALQEGKLTAEEIATRDKILGLLYNGEAQDYTAAIELILEEHNSELGNRAHTIRNTLAADVAIPASHYNSQITSNNKQPALTRNSLLLILSPTGKPKSPTVR